MTEFVRLKSFASYQAVVRDTPATFSVDHISSSIALPASVKIALRQKSTEVLKFVTITNGETSASITINADSTAYYYEDLILESYDSS